MIVHRLRQSGAAREFYGLHMLDIPSAPPAGADYVTVKRAIEFISKRYRDQPSVEAIAEHVGLSASHFQHVFKRWAGLTPKAFLQAITIERARELLRNRRACSTRPMTSACPAQAGCTICSSPTRR